jgi:hypothetical protein
MKMMAATMIKIKVMVRRVVTKTMRRGIRKSPDLVLELPIPWTQLRQI